METQSQSKTNADNTKVEDIVKKPLTLDDVLVNELGQFGWFQLRNILLVAIPILMSAFPNEYNFSAAAIPHRCQIPECGEVGKTHKYDPEWIFNAIPKTDKGIDSCQRYTPMNLESNGTWNDCPATLFNNFSTVACEGFVYAKNNTVVYEFDLGCQDWLRALAGTFNSIGTLLVLPITGYVSDRFGRRFALVISVLNLGTIGLIRAFSVNYTMYLILQILQTTLGAGTYSTAYIFVTELVGPKYRVFTSATSSSLFGLGQVILGSIAWLISPWRSLLMALHIPCFLIISYYWILSESLRWLLSKKKYSEAKEVLQTIARVNKTSISEKSLNTLLQQSERIDTSQSVGPGLVRTIIRSPVLRRRVCTTPIWWITAIFVYYGLSINSTGLSDTMHLNYILTCAIEIPGFYTAVLVLDRIGRKATLSSCYFICAICNIAFVFIPSDLTVLRLIIYLLGKFSISTVMTSMYLFTSELYPTEFRHTLLAFSSMVGRIGAVIAPLTPVLKDYWHGIPSFMFAGMAILSALLVFTQPETLGIKLPDTLAEAEAIGNMKLKKEMPEKN
ncbi:organic cation transporter protein-like [Pararge aegeria]|uniref:Jg15631 protein n=1 Tax=Pararge aegeria aegeria TaxID=348720 RepID=A0A8S4RSY2_9NEOP|nr:organic cation transporter protein-like [Pararge aegeria]CAH2241434.1 jg15631 [Pararge aegeria aegeria]